MYSMLEERGLSSGSWLPSTVQYLRLSLTVTVVMSECLWLVNLGAYVVANYVLAPSLSVDVAS